MTAEEAASEADYVTGAGNIVPKGQIKTHCSFTRPRTVVLVDWEFQNADDYKGVTLHDGLTVGVGDVTLQPGESYESPCMCSPLQIRMSRSPSARPR